MSELGENRSHTAPHFDMLSVETALLDTIPELEVIWMDSTESTNLQARNIATHKARNWTVVVAGNQTAGRGRYTRSWASPPGGLYQSVLLQIPDCESPITLIPLLVGLSLKDAIESELGRLGGGAFHGWLKWPNDLITGRGKLAGILCEAAKDGDTWGIIVGTGMNIEPVVLENMTSDQLQSATSLKSEHPAVRWTRENLMIAYLRKLHEWLEIWQANPEAVREAWMDASGIEGKVVVATSMGNKITGVATGIGDNGELLIETKRGVHKLNAAEALIVHDEWNH
jgi:BirA family transcriptional regulator, biotin operon repressor / biotin---[acetyl-CoA-carboxylase] ligase